MPAPSRNGYLIRLHRKISVGTVALFVDVAYFPYFQ